MSWARTALADAAPTPYWLDTTQPGNGPAPATHPRLTSHVEADLAVVGGGYTGLWTALLAKEADPTLDVVVLEARTVGGAASGRNGGFCAASLTHGLANGLDRWPTEMRRLERLGMANLDAIEETVTRHGIDCQFERTGELRVATEPWHVPELRAGVAAAREVGIDRTFVDQAETRRRVNSPTYLGAFWSPRDFALVHPAKLAWGLRDACARLGVRFHEHSPVVGVERADRAGGALRLHTPWGSVRAPKVAWGTGAFRGPLRRLRSFVVPVYDYAMVTEPLSAEQLASVGWRDRQALADAGNQFHYYRLTADNRVLWGGYDAVYHYGDRINDQLDQRPETFLTLSEHFFRTFPQLTGLRFTHTWGGVVDTSSRFTALHGRAYGGRLVYTVGYTGLGVAATRFGARVMLDLLHGRRTELTELTMVKRKPLPFPPEPLRYVGIELTRRAIARADANGGRRNLWLRTLDRLGMGFDS
ncbi:FAD-dependent oxidoreductase [Streptomyces sp. DSM 44915]|uniref:FAD-dependent oxidoreductase n=1 Tax=Streptomyces chisholmiae TaxID=3075540 RepID=A0ABU2JV49_9ACTN|nr:FAD-dependent oxidoreductase [Streptomyces sp. DSM 44915]MDT0268847.1 FAD-dependent oxidoreductase [Streptomyces sp. DSM 44915]